MKIIDKILKEILIHPNEDMLIIKPNLFYYAPIEQLESAKEKGIKSNNNYLQCFFQRIPTNLNQYSEFLENSFLVKISIQKLKRIKDQKVSILSKNLPGYEDNRKLSSEEIKQLCQKTDMMSKYLQKDYELNEVPSCLLYLSSGFLPSWVFKVIENIDEQ